MSVLRTEMCYSKGYWPRVRPDPFTRGTAITHKMRARLSPALICTTMDVQKPPLVTGDLLWIPPWVQPRSKWGEVTISGYSRTRTGSGWAGKTHKTLTQKLPLSQPGRLQFRGYVWHCFLRACFFQLMPVLYGWTSLLVPCLYRTLYNWNLVQSSPEDT